MMQKATLFRSTSQDYKNAVIDALTKQVGMPEAFRLFGQYYLPVKKVWGYEPNAEEFAKHIVRLDKQMKNRPAPGYGVTIRVRAKTSLDEGSLEKKVLVKARPGRRAYFRTMK